jgi:FKBP-type peptidyl-prolyl cis-trans isomerase
MIKRILIGSATLLFFSCSTESVKKQDKPEEKKVSTDHSLDKSHQVVDTKLFDNGLVIDWYEKGTGELIEPGDVVDIDFKVRLKNGEVVDGNHLLKLKSFPFMVGFQMQTEGWDLAFQSMRVGDFARIKIPSHLARGEKGLGELIPPNADNILTVRILKERKPDRQIDGNKVWIIEENKDNKTKFGEGSAITFHAMVSSPSNPLYANTFRSNQPFTYSLGDQGIVPGLRKALINAKNSDRMYVYVPSSEAYGTQGYMDIVKPGEALFYNMMVMDIVKK